MTNYHQTALSPIFSVTDLVSLFRTSLPAGYVEEPETFSFWQLIYAERGSLAVRVGDFETTLTAGGAIVLPPEIPHLFTDVPEPGCDVGIVTFCFAKDQHGDTSALSGRVFPLRADDRHLTERLFDEGCDAFSWFDSDSPLHGMYVPREDAGLLLGKLKLRLETLLASLCEYGTRDTRGSKKQTNRDTENRECVEAYLRAHLAEPLTVSRIAADVGISVSGLKRLYRASAGGGVIDRLSDIRIAEAMRLIRTTSMNLTEIAEHLGYSSLFYFSRVFRRKVGVPPSEYGKSPRS